MKAHSILGILLFALTVKAGPPVSVDTPLSFQELQTFYGSGVSTSESQLLGSWKLVAQAPSAGCDAIKEAEEDWKGIKDVNGSFQELVFKYVAKQVPGADSPQNIFSVLVWEPNGQGPFKVSSSEPQFSAWGYDLDGISDEFYISFFCRAGKATKNQLICATKYNRSGSSGKEESTCFQKEVAAYLLFTKME